MTRAEYETYLLGEHWRDFSYIIKRNHPYCAICKISWGEAEKKYRQALNVHHKTYKNLGKEKPEDVIVLCRQCHLNAHGLGDLLSLFNRKAMPDVKPLGYVRCFNCQVESAIPIWNMDDPDEWICWECRI